MASRTSQTTFDRALALLDGDQSFQRSPRGPPEQHDDERGMSESDSIVRWQLINSPLISKQFILTISS
jgi:hypothetical protein